MKNVFSFCFLILFSEVFCQENHKLIWFEDFDLALEKAQETKKPILLRFQGSDWCANCLRLDTVLFETKQFSYFAKNKFVLLVLDFPSKPENQLSEKRATRNKEIFNKYKPQGFPAIYILDSNGRQVEQLAVTPNPTQWYIDQLKNSNEIFQN